GAAHVACRRIDLDAELRPATRAGELDEDIPAIETFLEGLRRGRWPKTGDHGMVGGREPLNEITHCFFLTVHPPTSHRPPAARHSREGPHRARSFPDRV